MGKYLLPLVDWISAGRAALLTSGIALACAFACRMEPAPPDEPYADLVDLHIGAISHLLQPTLPTVQLPNAMMRLYPVRSPGISDAYLAPRIYGFPLMVTSHRARPLGLITPTLRDTAPVAESAASGYDHDFEEVRPYYYQVLLEDPGIEAAFSVTERGAIYRFHYRDHPDGKLIFRLTGPGYIHAEGKRIAGEEKSENYTLYFYAETDPEPRNITNLPPDSGKTADALFLEGDGISLDYSLGPEKVLHLRIACSFISAEQARANFDRELAGRRLDELRFAARSRWNEQLGSIRIEGGTEDERIYFYTALCRSFERMISISEDGRYYSPFDRQVHEDGGHEFYVDDWIWDTYRSLHPLRMILRPDIEVNMLRSYIRMYEQSGWLPSFPLISGDMGAMIGHHQAAFFADAWQKGIRDFDLPKAYEGLRKNATEGTMLPWREGPATDLDRIYREKGFFPAKEPGVAETVPEVHSWESRQAVSVTLEHAYDDWCLAQLARELGREEDYAHFMKRGKNYETLYHPSTGWMQPRAADGSWIEPFDPKMPSGPGGRDFFAESNSWNYTWSVPHDLAGLVRLMGGEANALARLDDLFEGALPVSKWQFQGAYPDDTGLTGLYIMGNQPGFHIPYIYNYLGAPWKTQKRVRQLLSTWFRNDLMGICGDEDGGSMSAWYVFSSLGFYPFCPGLPVYTLTGPLFERSSIRTGSGKVFTITANGVSAQNKYIQSAVLNGQPLDRTWIFHHEIMDGGELAFEMGSQPNRTWASGSSGIPPDFTPAGK
jgi:predicted alpha-1,2-mannosidase